MAKRTKRKRAATSRSRTKSTGARGKATRGKQPARRAKATRTSASPKARARGRRGTSPATPRRSRADIAGVSERANELTEIPTDPARFDGDAPPDAAAQARRVADAMAGDEEPGGSVMTPDHNSGDEWAAALGVERSPDSPVRSSEEILHERDDRRSPGGPDPEQQRRTI